MRGIAGAVVLVTACTEPQVEDPSSVAILLGGGDGAFTLSEQAPSWFPRALAVADFDKDGCTDVAVANPKGVGVLFGTCHGTLRPLVQTELSEFELEGLNGAAALAAADINADGATDIVAASFGGAITCLRGEGDGHFQIGPATYFASGTRAVVLSDVNADGFHDLVIPSTRDGKVRVLLGDGAFSFRFAWEDDLGLTTYAAVTTDLNEDTYPDLVVTNWDPVPNHTLDVLRGNGTGMFVDGGAVGSGGGLAISAGDLNNDGHQDVVTSGDVVRVFFGDGLGGLSAPTLPTEERNTLSILVTDLNNDNHDDLVVLGTNGASVFLARDTAWPPPTVYETGDTPIGAVVSDFNMDGLIDIAVANSGGNTL